MHWLEVLNSRCDIYSYNVAKPQPAMLGNVHFSQELHETVLSAS